MPGTESTRPRRRAAGAGGKRAAAERSAHAAGTYVRTDPLAARWTTQEGTKTGSCARAHVLARMPCRCSSFAKSPIRSTYVLCTSSSTPKSRGTFLHHAQRDKEFLAGSSTTTLQLSYGSLTPDPADARRQDLTCASAAARTHGHGHGTQRSADRHTAAPPPSGPAAGDPRPSLDARGGVCGRERTQPIRTARTTSQQNQHTRLEIPAKATSLPRLLLALRRGFRSRPARPRTKVGRAPPPIHNSHAAHHVTRRRPRRGDQPASPPLY